MNFVLDQGNELNAAIMAASQPQSQAQSQAQNQAQAQAQPQAQAQQATHQQQQPQVFSKEFILMFNLNHIDFYLQVITLQQLQNFLPQQMGQITTSDGTPVQTSSATSTPSNLFIFT